ncbi:hypothetical protein [Fusobacterium sp.]|uniref:hypothetical protein n=1 Tax=Fusobacterium sp. TaxID=68766 RepID=UPI000E9E6D31|nr:hypothetical protein [Fusobacterium sp.]HBJ77965.1 hypothetical protein [Fusobacterium sp.]
MNMKDMIKFIDRKYSIKRDREIEPLQKEKRKIIEIQDEKIKQLNEKFNSIYKEEMEKIGYIFSDKVNVSLPRWNISNGKIKEITNNLELEKQKFIDEMIILGIKSTAVKEKLEKLLSE